MDGNCNGCCDSCWERDEIGCCDDHAIYEVVEAVSDKAHGANGMRMIVTRGDVAMAPMDEVF